MELVVVVVAAVAAGVVGFLGPTPIAALPEPDDTDKTVLYADVARRRDAPYVMAVVAALSAGLVAWRLDTPELVPAWVAMAGVGAWMGYIDWHSRYLPFHLNAFLYPVVWLLVGLAALLLQDPRMLLRALVANVVLYLIYRFIYWSTRRKIGYGDVRLAGVLGVVLGAVSWEAALLGFYAGIVLGGVFALLGLVKVLKILYGREFALGPALLLGAVVGAVWGVPVG